MDLILQSPPCADKALQRIGVNFVKSLAFIALLAGCQPPLKPPEILPVERPPARPTPPPPDAVAQLLAAAAEAFKRDQLTLPEAGSAHALYREVLALAPSNKAAQRGLEKIVERYVDLALTAAERQRYPQGRLMLARARQVDPAHPAIEPTERQLHLLGSAHREKVQLDGGQLRRRAEVVQRSLERLGSRAGQSGCRVTISARSDDEGRWVYQQLNRGAGAARVRARLTVASPPAVELICFSQAG